MRAIRFHSTGGPEVLQLDEMALPEPGSGEIRIGLRFAGVNFIDTYFRGGLYDRGPLPARVGKEGAGVVTAVGDGVGDGIDGPRVGDRVAFWDRFGYPAVTPLQGVQLDAWWIDPVKDVALAGRKAGK